MNRIVVSSVQAEGHKIKVRFSLEGSIQQYFKGERAMAIEYSESVESVPYGIAVIPFVANVLPVCWLSDAELVVDELDRDFYESIPEIKHGYIFMYRRLRFKGHVACGRIADYSGERRTAGKDNGMQDDRNFRKETGAAVLFSGGVDAFATLFAHIEERPVLVTLHGADVKLNDDEGWANVVHHVKETARNLNLPTPVLIRTNFREIIRESELNKLVLPKGRDNWWHGFQHGIGISSHAAPVGYKKGLHVVYMASSFTVDYTGPCASDPNIEGHLRFCGCRIFHDRYSFSRQDKIRLIVQKREELKSPIQLRVCWISTGGKNCCRCEKCFRTMAGILAEGGKPEEYGFGSMDEFVRNGYKTIIRPYSLCSITKYSWDIIRAACSRNGVFEKHPELSWLRTLKADRRIVLEEAMKRPLRYIYHLARMR